MTTRSSSATHVIWPSIRCDAAARLTWQTDQQNGKSVKLGRPAGSPPQVCYGAGAREIPAGDQPWYCDMCRFSMRSGTSSRRVEQECILCPEKGGAMKRTTDSRWAHIT